jgi:uncharacterized protein
MHIEKELINISSKFEYIKIIMIFGSYARKDNDKNSDIDIFILIDNCKFSNYIERKNNIISVLKIPADYVSIYTYDGFSLLKDKGSYFLWHLKKEGILIYDSKNEYNNLFRDLKRYNRAKEDLLEYKEICKDIINNKRYGCEEKNYDLSVLASIIRNCCITISYLHGEYLFDKIKSVEYVKNLMGEKFPFTFLEYENIYNYRIKKNRNVEVSLVDVSDKELDNWCNKAIELIDYGLHIVNSGGDINESFR